MVDKAMADTLVKDFGLHYDMLVAVLREKEQDAQALFGHHAIAEPLSFRETPPRNGKDGFGETPLTAIVPIF
jgi:hypothetical protein